MKSSHSIFMSSTSGLYRRPTHRYRVGVQRLVPVSYGESTYLVGAETSVVASPQESSSCSTPPTWSAW